MAADGSTMKQGQGIPFRGNTKDAISASARLLSEETCSHVMLCSRVFKCNKYDVAEFSSRLHACSHKSSGRLLASLPLIHHRLLLQDVVDAIGTPEWRMLLFTTCFMHAVLLQRRTFGPIGFSDHYDFCHSDLQASIKVRLNDLWS